MTDRPIPFIAPMVRALLAGRKTMTRRRIPAGHVYDDISSEFAEDLELRGWDTFWCGEVLRAAKLRYEPGDRLWVREAWRTHRNDDNVKPRDLRQDADIWREADREPSGIWPAGAVAGKLRPGMFMPRWASRITLLVNDVTVERLHDISEADAIAEGIDPLFDAETVTAKPECDLRPMPWVNYLWHGHVGRGITQAQSDRWRHQFSSYIDARGSYSSLWERINGASSWDANPWVAAIRFRVVRSNIDHLPAEAA